MNKIFKQGMAITALSLSLLTEAHALEIKALCEEGLDSCNGVVFTSVPSIPSLSTANCGTPVQVTYPLQNQGSVATTLYYALTEIDNLGAGTVTIDGSSTCPNSGGSLGASASCNIVLDFQPCAYGTLDWDLTVTPSPTTLQKPLVLPLETTVASVSGSVSLAGGQYNAGLLLAANPNNTGWSYVMDSSSLPPPNYYDASSFDSVSCSSTVCIAGGAYEDNSHVFGSLIAQSANAGSDWVYVMDDETAVPANFAAEGSVKDVSCTDSGALSVCTVAGDYQTNSSAPPFLAVSINGGNWSYAVEDGVNLPSNFDFGGSFAGVSCSGSLCAAAGSYQTSTSLFPMIAVSTNNGSSWTYTLDDVTGPVPFNFSQGESLSVSCSGSLCIAGGYYTDSSFALYPTLAVSTNSGSTWTYQIDSNALPPNYDSTTDRFSTYSSVSCSGNLCGMGAVYLSGGSVYPFLSLSSDGGDTWNYVIDSTQNLPSDFEPFPSNFFIQQYASVACSEGLGVCAMGGQYQSNMDNNDYPYLAVSTDSGSTWTYVIDSTTNLPADFSPANGGHVYNVSCSASQCLASGNYGSTNSNHYPFLYQTSDGVTWDLLIDSNVNNDTIAPPGDLTYGGFYSSFASTLRKVVAKVLTK